MHIHMYKAARKRLKDEQRQVNIKDASSMVTAGATANTTVKNSRASRESLLLCSHSHGESIAGEQKRPPSCLPRTRVQGSTQEISPPCGICRPPPLGLTRGGALQG